LIVFVLGGDRVLGTVLGGVVERWAGVRLSSDARAVGVVKLFKELDRGR
jgi:hypothetical protein